MASEENMMNEGQEEVPDQIVPFDTTKKKKKKKKKKVVIQDHADDPMEGLVENTENLAVSDGLEPSLTTSDEFGEGEDNPSSIPEYSCEGTGTIYEYEGLLARVFNILRQNNPKLAVGGDRRRTVMRPPQVLREGTKKTVFVNFMELCKMMHRQPEHVMAFLLAEMGTSGSLDGQQRLVIKGRFAPKNFEGILRRYVNEYVICNGCKTSNTVLTKENRLFFLRCEQCGSGRTVAPIKAGFVARVGRRKDGA